MNSDEMIDLIKNLKRDEDYIIKDGKVFVHATPYQLLEDDLKGNILPDDIIEKGEEVFVEYNAYAHSLFEALRADPSLEIKTKFKKKSSDGSERISLSKPQAIAQFGVMASIFNRVARYRDLPKSEEVSIDGVLFLELFDMALFRLDEFTLYMHVYEDGGLRKEMDRVCDIPSKRQMRFTKDGKSYYAWDIIGLIFMGAQMEEFRHLDLKDTDKVSKWYAETVEEINRVANELPKLMRIVSRIMGYNDTKDEDDE